MNRSNRHPTARPRRAQPLQPDQPKQGDEQIGRDDYAPTHGADKLKKQVDDAVSNVREGYGGGHPAEKPG